jgi:hypothetical protein
MRTGRALVLLAALLVTGATLIGAAPADAGGPTSVVLTNPGQGQATALYYTDPRYAELETLLHSGGETGAKPPAGATYLNVTWLIHDAYIWRTDQVFLDGSNQVTVASTLEDSTRSTAIRLDKADSAAVVALASSLGLMKPGVGQPGTASEEAAAAAPDSEPAAAPTPVVREETRWFSLSGWRWALPGLLLGLVVAVAVRGRRLPPAGPRQELIDGAPLALDGFDGFDRAAGQGRT